MKRTSVVLSALLLSIILSVTAFAQAPATSSVKPEHFSKQQLNTLIADAKTPAQHERIAQFYEAKANVYSAEATEHEAMVAAYKANTNLSNNKNQSSTISHCEYFVQTFKDKAVKSHELSQLHEQMAKEFSK